MASFVGANVATMEGSVYLGVTDRVAEGVWVWPETGGAMVYTNGASPPDNGGCTDCCTDCTGQDCAIMHNGEVGYWLDLACTDWGYQPLCEYDWGEPGRLDSDLSYSGCGEG